MPDRRSFFTISLQPFAQNTTTTRSLHLLVPPNHLRQQLYPQCPTTGAASRPSTDWASSKSPPCSSPPQAQWKSPIAPIGETYRSGRCPSVPLKTLLNTSSTLTHPAGARPQVSGMRDQRPNSLGHSRQAMSPVWDSSKLSDPAPHFFRPTIVSLTSSRTHAIRSPARSFYHGAF